MNAVTHADYSAMVRKINALETELAALKDNLTISEGLVSRYSKALKPFAEAMTLYAGSVSEHEDYPPFLDWLTANGDDGLTFNNYLEALNVYEEQPTMEAVR